MEKLKSSVLYCIRCGSGRIELVSWEDRRSCTIRCEDCNNESILSGFTIGTIELNSYQLQSSELDREYPGKAQQQEPPWLSSYEEEPAPDLNTQKMFHAMNIAVREGFCPIHNLAASIDLGSGGDMNIASISSCCVDYRAIIIKKIKFILNEHGAESQMIIHNSDLKKTSDFN